MADKDVGKIAKETADAVTTQAEKDQKAQEKRAREKARADKLHHRELLMKVSGLNITQLAQQKRDESALAERKRQLEELKSSMEAMGLSVEGNKKIAKEEAKIAKAEIKLQTQNQSSLSKLVNFLTPGGPGDKEKENQDNRRFAKTMAVFGSIKEGIGNVAGSLAEKGKAIGGGMFDILKKGALFMAIPALIAFMRSPMFDDLKTWIVDKLVPALKKITDEIIIPVAVKIWDWVNGTAMPAMVDFVVSQFEAITNLFTNIKARFDGWSEKSFKEKIFAVLGVFEDLGTFVLDTATNMFIAIFDLFGLDGSAMAEKYIAPIRSAISAVIDWIKLAFTDPKAALDALWKGIKSLGSWLWENTVMKAWNAITGLFGFSSEDEKEAAGDLAVGDTQGMFSKVLHAIIPEGVFTFIKDPLGWFWKNVLGISTGVDGKMPSAAEAAAQIKAGKADGIFAKVLGAILPAGMIEFILNPIDYIFTKILKLGGPDAKSVTAAEKAGIVLGSAVGLFEKVLKAILPDGLVDMLMSPVNWLFRSVLGIEPNQILDSAAEAHGVEKGDATGLWQSMLEAVLPAGLARFLGDPIGYIFTDILKLGGEGEKMPSTLEQSKMIAGTAVGLWEKLLKAILPDGVVDFVMKPIDWLFESVLGIKIDETMDSVAEAHGLEKGDASGIFNKILSAILPQGVMDFIAAPFEWLKTKLGLGSKADTESMLDKFQLPSLSKLLGNIFKEIIPESWITGSTWLGRQAQKIMPQAMLDFLQNSEQNRMGGFLPKGTMSLVGESGPELMMSGGNSAVIASHQLKAGMDFARMSALAGKGPIAGETGRVVNNIVNSVPMTTTNVANTRVNAAVGVNDPFTSVAVAY